VDRFDVDALNDSGPFEIDQQAGHLFKHPGLGLDDFADIWGAIRCSIRPSLRPIG
jgi:hypothetical protein